MKTLRVTLADIIGPTGTPNSTATVHARYVDTSGRGRDVHLTDGTIVVPVRRTVAPGTVPQHFDFDVYANDVAPVREVDYGHLVEVSWTVVAPTGAKSSGVKRVQITDSMASVVQLGLLATPTPVPPYTGGYVLPGELDALDARVVVLEAGGGGGGGGVTVHNLLTGRSTADAHPTSAITGLDAALAGKATAAQGAKADTAVQPADLTAGLATKAATSHSHATSDVTGLDAALTGKASTTHGHVIADTTGLQAALDAKAATSHTHTGVYAPVLGADDNYVTDAEKAALHTHPAVIAQGATQADARTAIGAGTSSLAIGTTAGTAAEGNDSRLTDARTPTAHVHAGADITTGTVAYARLPVGTTASTVAAGDDSRIGKIGGTVTVTGTPTAGQVPVASSGTAAAWGSAGGGGASFPAQVPVSTAWYTSPILSGSPTGAAWPIINRAYLAPFCFTAATTITALGVYVVAASAAANVVRLGIFRNSGWAPAAITEQGTVAGDSIGFKTVTLGSPVSVSAGEVVWVAACPQGSGAPGSTWLGAAAYFARTPDSGASWAGGFGSASIYFASTGAFTSSPTPSFESAARHPAVAVRVS